MRGYCVNGYHLWCPENKILFGKDIIFDELLRRRTKNKENCETPQKSHNGQGSADLRIKKK